MRTIFLLVAAVLITSPQEWCGVAAAASADLRTKLRTGDLSRVTIDLEVGGDLKLDESAKTEGPVKMSVAARLTYEEKVQQFPVDLGGALRSARHYEETTATLKIAQKTVQPALHQEHRLIGVQVEGGATTLYSPAGPLTREELDLIDVPGNSLLADLLLPEKTVRAGETWKHPDSLMAALFGVDKVTRNAVESTLTGVFDGLARMQLSGRLEGTVGGAATIIEVKGKYQFDLTSRRVHWLGLLMHEVRTPGEAAPGLDVVARLQMQITPAKQPVHLTSAALKKLLLDPTPEALRLTHSSTDGRWKLTHERPWHVTADEREVTVLRFLDKGQRLAQCNISSLPKADEGRPLALAEFQDDVKQALGKSFGEFVEAAESTNTAGYRIHRVVVRSVVSDLPIQWHYYLVADPHGNRVALAFTIDGRLVSRLDDADRRLVNELRFVESEVAAKPQPSLGKGVK